MATSLRLERSRAARTPRIRRRLRFGGLEASRMVVAAMLQDQTHAIPRIQVGTLHLPTILVGQVVAMDQDRLERLFADQVDAIAGPPGALQSKVDGIPVYCISDSASDWMRIVAPIRPLTGLDPRLLEVLLRANFHISRDARYAISEDFVFAAFVHPISSLSPELIASALDQVVTLAKNFGTTYSSRNLAAPVLDSEILDDPQ